MSASARRDCISGPSRNIARDSAKIGFNRLTVVSDSVAEHFPDTQRLAYGVFSGGGAKGFAHIGALQAAEEFGVFFLGVAGTSAGAIVAALIAVGFNSQEMFDLLREFGSPAKLFDDAKWTAVRRLADALEDPGPFRVRVAAPLIEVVLRIALLGKRKGLLDLDKLIDKLNTILLAKINDMLRLRRQPLLREDFVKFRHLGLLQPEFTPLTIIATDIARNRVVMFSTEETPDVVIAEAVAASAAVPILFRPVTVHWSEGERRRAYLDGGLASNIPAWVFQQRKFIDSRTYKEPIQTLAFELQSRLVVSPVESLNFLRFANRVASCTLSTGQSVTNEFVEDLASIALPCDLRMLEFDASAKRIRDVRAAAYNAAQSRLKDIYLRPAAIEAVLVAFLEFARGVLTEQGLPGDIKLRVCCIEPILGRHGRAAVRNFRVCHACNFDADADDKLLLDARANGAPEAFMKRVPVVWDIGSLHEEAPITKYERASLWSELQTAVTFPVFRDERDWNRDVHDRSTPIGVVSLDADSDLRPYMTDEILEILALRTTPLSAAFGD